MAARVPEPERALEPAAEEPVPVQAARVPEPASEEEAAAEVEAAAREQGLAPAFSPAPVQPPALNDADPEPAAAAK
jgi:hypothetical protein